MKTLYLLRHAKADNTLPDLERDLTSRGRRQAQEIGRWMAEKGIRPDLILSSPAKRAKETAHLCSKQAGYQGKIHLEDDLYEADMDKYLDIIADLKNKYDSVLIVGHNPHISAAVTILTGEHLNMSTGMLACIEIRDDKWNSVKNAKVSLKWVQAPE